MLLDLTSLARGKRGSRVPKEDRCLKLPSLLSSNRALFGQVALQYMAVSFSLTGGALKLVWNEI